MMQNQIIRELLEESEFQRLFLEILLWDHPRRLESRQTLQRESYRVIPLAEQGGFIVFQVQSENAGNMPYKVYRERLAKKLKRTVCEHLLIFTGQHHSYSLWHWIDRNEHQEMRLDVHCLTDEQMQMLDRLKFDHHNISITAVTERVYGTLRAMCTPLPKYGGKKMATIDEALNTVFKAINRTDQALDQLLGDPTIPRKEKRKVLDISDSLGVVLEKAQILKNEWDSLKEQYPLLTNLKIERVPVEAAPRPARRTQRRQNVDRLPRGERTPESAYRVPILQALVELGGQGTVADVLNKVYEQMEDRLQPVDHEHLERGGPRWRNTAMWERYNMKNMGYLRNDSPRGIWEITEAGRDYLDRLVRG